MASTLILLALVLVVDAVQGTEIDVHCTNLVGRWPAGGVSMVAIEGDHVYFNRGIDLMIAKIHSPDSLEVVGEITVPGITDLAIVDDIVYVAARGNGLRIVDVSEPRQPIEIGAIENDDYVRGVGVADGLLVVALGWAGLRAYDVTTPSTPVEVFSLDAGYPTRVAVTNHFVFVADGSQGLVVFSRSEPTVLRHMATVEVSGWAERITVTDEAAFIGTFEDGLHVFDISAPWNPILKTSIEDLDHVRSIAASGTTVFVGNDGGLRVFDMTDLASPLQIGRFGTKTNLSGIELLGARGFLALRTGGLVVVDISDLTPIVEVASIHLPSQAGPTAISGSMAYVTDRERGLWTVDLSRPREPHEIGVALRRYLPTQVAVSGRYALVADTRGLQVIDVADPSSPLEVGFLFARKGATAVAEDSGFVYLPQGGYSGGGLQVIDISEPSSPTEVGYLDLDPHGDQIVAAEGLVYLGEKRSGLRIIDVSDPHFPVEISHLPLSLSDVSDLEIVDDRAFLSTYYPKNMVYILDVGDPYAPAEVASIDWLTFPIGLDVVGNTLYAGDRDGVHLIDINDPANPFEARLIETSGEVGMIESSGDWIYVSVEDEGMLVLKRCPPWSREPGPFEDRPVALD